MGDSAATPGPPWDEIITVPGTWTDGDPMRGEKGKLVMKTTATGESFFEWKCEED